jgi:hypothetical protein
VVYAKFSHTGRNLSWHPNRKQLRQRQAR